MSDRKSLRPQTLSKGPPDAMVVLRKRVASLEDELVQERKERAREAETFAKMLKRTSEVETEARALRDRVLELEAEARDRAAGRDSRAPVSNQDAKRLAHYEQIFERAVAIFDELERGDRAIVEFRGRALEEARKQILGASGFDRRVEPPPIPSSGARRERAKSMRQTMDVEISELTEITRSLRPPSK